MWCVCSIRQKDVRNFFCFSHFMQTVKKKKRRKRRTVATEKRRIDSLKCFASTAQSGYLANHVFANGFLCTHTQRISAAFLCVWLCFLIQVWQQTEKKLNYRVYNRNWKCEFVQRHRCAQTTCTHAHSTYQTGINQFDRPLSCPNCHQFSLFLSIQTRRHFFPFFLNFFLHSYN